MELIHRVPVSKGILDARKEVSNEKLEYEFCHVLLIFGSLCSVLCRMEYTKISSKL